MAAETMEQRLAELVKAAVHLAILRHDLGDDEMDIDAILEDSANAVRGIDTCAEEPIPEWRECLRLMALNERELNASAFVGVKVLRGEYLPKATIVASADVYDSMGREITLPEQEEK